MDKEVHLITDWEEVRRGVRMCLNKLSFSEMHDDIEQEAMLRAITYQHTFRGDSTLSTWGYSIARSTAMGFFQKKRDDPVMYDTDLMMMHSEDVPAFDDTGFHESAVYREIDALAELILTEVPKQWLPQLIDRDLHGMRYQEISHKYNLPIGTICSSLSRARETLRPKLKELLDSLDGDQTKFVIQEALKKAELQCRC